MKPGAMVCDSPARVRSCARQTFMTKRISCILDMRISGAGIGGFVGDEEGGVPSLVVGYDE